MSIKLEEWREREGLTRAWVAEALGVGPGTICRYELGRIPAAYMLRKIYDLTDGEVDANAFYDLGRS